ncbi:hypothetical protein AK830_g2557 [Neonectria ditissima]|uniref:mRNA degradation protein pet127, mitochondrial n=1 Tax=Neonectria ditissima TaxID=78410 RepID=A0A0P7B2W0_9HYPO|nr:hypothetical protein AK830_g2557 [Neonectria ditissima]
MLRLRCGASQSIRLAQLCWTPARPSLQGVVRCQTFATRTKPPVSDPPPGDVDERWRDAGLSGLEPQDVVREWETESAPTLDYPLETSDNFDDALNVVRKVYGVKESVKSAPKPTTKTRKKRRKPTETSQDQANSTGKPGSLGQAMGMWTSLREKLEQEAPADVEDPGHRPAPVHPGPRRIAHRKAREMKKPVRKFETTRRPPRLFNETSRQQEDEDKDPKIVKDMKDGPGLIVKKIKPHSMALTPVELDQLREVPTLAHDLDRVLFNRGVYDLQDSHSGTFNFDPYLASIMPVKEFDFNALKEYITSSKDTKLRDLCTKYGKKYCGSTSSMTSVLAHFHFLLSAWRPPNFDALSRNFEVEHQTFTAITRAPAAVFANYKDGVYAIDADKKFDTANILSMLGKSMEKLLTLPKEEFEKYRRDRSHQLSDEEKNADEAFHYTTFGDFMMRSQLDAHDARLPTEGMFDLKTRAVVSIRMDVADYEKGVGYEIRNRTGQWQSYEREYYDMIRSAFLKYSLQVRMGRMDGIFVAYHNTERIFGFQYISLSEMDESLHGTSDTETGDVEFKTSLKLLNELLNRATERFPQRSLRLHVETRETNPPLTYFFAEPVSESEVERTQAYGKKSVEKFETEVLGIVRKGNEREPAQPNQEVAEVEEDQTEEDEEEEIEQQEASQDLQGQSVWKEMMLKVDETVENDSLGVQSVRDAIHEALEQSGLLRGKSVEEKESYLNDLVQALTVELSEGKGTDEGLGEEQQARRDALHKRDGTLDEGIDGHGAETGETTIEASTKEAEESAGGATGLVDESVNENAIEGVSEVADQDANFISNDMTPDLSLKDLIIKVAQSVDHKSPNLGTFERVLSQLAAESNQPGDDSSQREGVMDSDESQSQKDTQATQFPGLWPDPDTTEGETRELLGMYVNVRNKVKGETVQRVDVEDSKKKGKLKSLVVEYVVTELPDARAQKIYLQLKGRRKKVFNNDPEARTQLWHQIWGGGLPKKVQDGRVYRGIRNKEAGPIKVAWNTKPILARGEAGSKR